jgi:hypothetical protein
MVTIETNLEVGLINSEKLTSKNLFIADSGATSHMRNTLEGMYDVEDWVVGVKVGNSEIMKSKKKGKFKGLVKQTNGTTLEVIITDVLYVPDLWVNLLSLVKVISNPNNSLTSNPKGEFVLHLGKQTQVIFDRAIIKGSGKLLGVEIIPLINENAETNEGAVTAQDYEHVHNVLGHPGETVTKATAKHLGIAIKKQPIDTCVDCAISKARQKNVPKVSKNNATMKGERVALDITSIRTPSYGGEKFWLMIQDEFTGKLWSYFLKAKSDLADTVN